jgi:riboflavin synthase
MFTGLIEDVGTVKSITKSQIEIETRIDDISKGGSVAVNGVCLTAVVVGGYSFSVDYSPNTNAVTALYELKTNSKVNLERALKLSSRLGGHIVSGHVDGTAKIKEISKRGNFYKISFLCGKEILRYIVDKGSVAVDGISLTVSNINSSDFEVFIIPETFYNTAMRFRKIGDTVNIETDILAKYIEKLMNKKTGSISFEMLKENGF